MCPGKRRWLLLLPVLFALLFHIALLRLLGASDRTRGHSADNVRVMSVIAARPRETADAGLAPEPQSAPTATSTPPTDRTKRERRPSQAEMDSPSSAESGAVAAVYLPSDVVDKKARPVTDWSLRPDVLLPDRLYVLTFTVWVSEQGRIDRWQLRDQSSKGAWAGEVLADLQNTAMVPALLDGRSVPVEMNVEIALDNRLR